MTELPKFLKEKHNISTIKELDDLLLSKLMSVVELVEDIECAGLDAEEHFPASALYIGLVKKEN